MTVCCRLFVGGLSSLLGGVMPFTLRQFDASPASRSRTGRPTRANASSEFFSQ